ncbi:MAG: PorP/SprF family type IX secretion system membrane protein [Saprospiraceae bacterium]
MKRLILILISLLAIGHVTLRAQQYPLFSNYWTQPYGFNPATITQQEGAVVGVQYRHQWTGLKDAPVTKLGTVQWKGSRWAVGGHFFQDEAGALQRTGGSAMLAYQQPLGARTLLSAGATAGYYQLRVRRGTRVQHEDDLLFLTAMDGTWFPDLNVGLHLQTGHFSLGLSVPQLLERRIRFGEINTTATLQRHYFVSAAYRFFISEGFQLQPLVLAKWGEDGDPQYDFSLRADFLQTFWLAGTYRSDVAAVALAGIQLNSRVELNYAYDFNTGGLRDYSRGSHEVGLLIGIGDRYRDADKDGVPDMLDKCRQEPGPAHNNGCPEDVLAAKGGLANDFDRDNIPDDLDNCPEVAGPAANQGCPWPDRDFDGIRDEIDDCPGLAGVESNNGCPIDDRDRDGIVDQFDECPDEPGTFVSRGCPDTDFDKDGLVNALDACPNTFGPRSNEGCPIVNERELNILNVAMRNLYFPSSKAEIYYKAYPHLDNLAALMRERADWELKIIGHTDDKGAADINHEVSLRRAEAVIILSPSTKPWIGTVIVEAYGETKPSQTTAPKQADNSTGE